MPTVNELYEQALQLDESDREALVNLIVGGFENAAGEVDDELLDELDRRCAEYDRGEVEGMDPFESNERLRRILREERGQ